MEGEEGEDGLNPVWVSLGEGRESESGFGLEMAIGLEMGLTTGADEVFDKSPKSVLALLTIETMSVSGP